MRLYSERRREPSDLLRRSQSADAGLAEAEAVLKSQCKIAMPLISKIGDDFKSRPNKTAAETLEAILGLN